MLENTFFIKKKERKKEVEKRKKKNSKILDISNCNVNLLQLLFLNTCVKQHCVTLRLMYHISETYVFI